ncbi:arabinanolytic transcriptional activator araR [Aspergillus lentulus]|nr:arabinanolytic transcriptional activator araR [Aspergillus lentulus]
MAPQKRTTAGTRSNGTLAWCCENFIRRKRATNVARRTTTEPWNDTADQRRAIRANNAVVHWFKSDLRLYDNRALRMAYQTAKEHNIPLTSLYILSPQDLTAHLLTPARVDLILRTLHQLKRHWSEPDIPLCMEAQNVRKSIPQRIVDLCQHWGANHRYRNLEYEVDELQRDKLVRLCAKNGINFETAHDACVVLRGQEPGCNLGDARKYFKELFDSEVPAAPENKQLSEEEKKQLSQLYPAGEHEALRRLEAFLEEKVRDYKEARNMMC